MTDAPAVKNDHSRSGTYKRMAAALVLLILNVYLTAPLFGIECISLWPRWRQLHTYRMPAPITVYALGPWRCSGRRGGWVPAVISPSCLTREIRMIPADGSGPGG